MAAAAYGFDEDVAVYSFDTLQDDDLAGMLDERLDALNDETFGALEDGNAQQQAGTDAFGAASAIGKDFDFAGNTAQALGKDLQPASSSWLAPAAPSTTSRQPQAAPSPWTALNSDPLLERTVRQTPSQSLSAQQLQPPPRQQQQQQLQPSRPNQFKTLDEIEAEMMRNAQQLQPVPTQQQRPLTLAEIEADMMRRRPQPVAQSPMQTQAMPPPVTRQSAVTHSPMLSQPTPPLGLPGQTSGQTNVVEQRSDMTTLFPPLPSQASVATLQQQLQYLTMNQHAQHPSLTNAQLQALLRQAQSQAAREGPGVNEQGIGGTSDPDTREAREQLVLAVEQRIREHEAMEFRRKQKAAKIASMAKFNNLMSNSDKDFITRIQVSQLVTEDPYADDFYFHIMAAIKMSRQQATAAAAAAAVNNAPNGPPSPQGQQMAQTQARRPNRRDNAMNRMAQNVQRLVDLAKQRNKDAHPNIEGALGKIASRTRSTPRQLLQVKPGVNGEHDSSAGTALLAGLVAQSSDAQDVTTRTETLPLTHRAACAILEKLYDIVLELEQLRRLQPQLLASQSSLSDQAVGQDPESRVHQLLDNANRAVESWTADYERGVQQLWSGLRIMEPLETSTPHPFISLLSVLKGKRIIARAMRHFSAEQNLTIVTLIVATFETLDTVRDAAVLDAFQDATSPSGLEARQKRASVVLKTDAFLSAIVAPLMSVIGQAPLRMVTGMLGLMMERNDLAKVLQSKPGLAFLTILLSRAESLRQAIPAPEEQDVAQWNHTFDGLFNTLSSMLQIIFPSNRLLARLPFGSSAYLNVQAVDTIRPEIDLDDEPVWQFLASVAVCANATQQQALVTTLRDKVLENVASAKRGRLSPETAALKIRNINLLLHSLGLDASQLTVDA
ncbi:hypothetical protein ACM66B_001067 [Microbotryomycetes sp. NB124-2]